MRDSVKRIFLDSILDFSDLCTGSTGIRRNLGAGCGIGKENGIEDRDLGRRFGTRFGTRFGMRDCHEKEAGGGNQDQGPHSRPCFR